MPSLSKWDIFVLYAQIWCAYWKINALNNGTWHHVHTFAINFGSVIILHNLFLSICQNMLHTHDSQFSLHTRFWLNCVKIFFCKCIIYRQFSLCSRLAVTDYQIFIFFHLSRSELRASINFCIIMNGKWVSSVTLKVEMAIISYEDVILISSKMVIN